mmetsp:Transcript_32417/g.48552  ORF Transcript_32417/g.48552 Transcript_32417/m.48552 type:complete len:167 (+) Transcript_32417:3-503(+)
MNPPVPIEKLPEIASRYTRGQELKVRIRRDGATITDMSIDEEDEYYEESTAIAAKVDELRKADQELSEALWTSGEHSTETYTGPILSIKDNCVFIRILDSREVRIFAGDLAGDLQQQDPVSKVAKTKRDALSVGMELTVKLWFDYRNNRICGTMSNEKKTAVEEEK